MDEVYVKFEGTGREGSVAVGTYLADAAKRLGVEIECDCVLEEPSAQCAVKILKGVTLLSKPTAFESEHLSASDRKDRQRLACQARLEKSGEIELMTVKKDTKKEEKKTEEKKDSGGFKEDFKEMPLKEKMSSLMELELIALGETVSYVINSPYEAFGKVMETMAGVGRDKEEKEREAKVPDEHAKSENGKKEDGKTSGKSKKGSATGGKAKPSKPSTAKRTRRRRKPAEKDEGDKG